MIARVEFFDGGNEKHVAKNSTDISTTKTVANYDPDNIFLLPEKVVSREGDSAFILVAGPDGHVHRRKIVSSPASDGMLAVTEGIRASDKIIVEPKTLQVGSLIHIQGIIENVTD